ncbi:invasion associated locus B family protein [Kiloniella laminariae]|uniref:Invasion associated locus B family protein n=1 Tax=Kiloniella laminariae TaxID=454162 RepID=A0ABT4LIT0_9PROT|nr:invasion associated locus B family protein [Kiloniella laminariae]MCZ4281019.1 invasion associated locus B family protein [Kiloniella laminariae]
MYSAIRTTFMAAVAFTAIAFSTGVQAQGVKVIAQHRDWTSYSYNEDGQKVCYMLSAPKKAEGSYSKRGDIYLMVSHRVADQRWNEVSIQTGYTFKPKSDAVLNVGKSRFTFFTEEDWAWAYDIADDEKIINAMIKGAELIVHGVSSRDTKTKDTYSLSGFSAAYRSINQACGKK